LIAIPEAFAAATITREGDRGRDWLAELPDLAQRYLRHWDCTQDGPVTAGQVAVVIPVASSYGPAMIKISFRHPGNRDEPAALRLWQGDGAVRLYDHEPDDFAILVERAEPRILDLPLEEALRIGGELSARLAVPAPGQMTRLADQAGPWEQQLLDHDQQADHPLPDRMLEVALQTIRDAALDDTTTMLHGDLHAGNILHSERGWLIIDPKGVAGNRAHDAATMFIYRHQEASAAADLRAETERRMSIFCSAAGADPQWTRRLIRARFVSGLLWEACHPELGTNLEHDLRFRVAALLT
jgi:streptomycin 6-kinase